MSALVWFALLLTLFAFWWLLIKGIIRLDRERDRQDAEAIRHALAKEQP